ncbi:17521_t:CDS:2, partial [Dentiscutata erythropus]
LFRFDDIVGACDFVVAAFFLLISGFSISMISLVFALFVAVVNFRLFHFDNAVVFSLLVKVCGSFDVQVNFQIWV